MPKSVDPGEKRAELVAASWDVIAAEGLKGATLRRVAAEAGCTTGALTHYFSDRRSLLVGALRAAHFQAGARMREASRRSADPLEQLEAILLEALPLDAARLREWRVWLAFWAEAMNDAELAKENARRYTEWRALLLEVVAPLRQDAATAEREVDDLIALVDGLGLRITRESANGAQANDSTRDCQAQLLRQLAHFRFESEPESESR